MIFDAFKFTADMLGLGPDAYPRGLSEAAKNLAENLDQSVANNYIEDGWADSGKTNPNIRNVVTQTPELIVLIKKRMFSSLKENFVLENMDDTEKAFIKAVKKMFENKCRQISAYERLTKAGDIIKKGGFNNSVVASVLDAIDYAEGITSWTGLFSESPKFKEFQKVTSKIRETLLHNQANTTTTWLKNSKLSQNADTGVIELTLVTSFNCTSSIRFGGGNASVSVLDPYFLLAINEQDIERAIYEISDSKFTVVNSLADNLEKGYSELMSNLNRQRIDRGASPVSMNINPFSVAYNRIIFSLDKYALELTEKNGNRLRNDLFEVSEEEAIKNLEGLLNVIVSDKNVISLNANILSLAETETFTFQEKNLLEEIYDKAVMIASLRQKDYSDFYNYGEKTNYIRRIMRENYLGKQIIQPMDIVTAFISSQTIDDNAALAGIRSMFSITDTTANHVENFAKQAIKTTALAASAPVEILKSIDGDVSEQLEEWINSGSEYLQERAETVTKYLQQQQFDITNLARSGGSAGLLGSLNKNIGDLKDLWGSVFGNNRTDYAMEVEKNLLAGPDFPMYLYQSLRSYFGSTDFGACVFNGVVNEVSESGNPGNNTVSILCKDNCYYFEQGLYQEKPGVNQFNGHLYNPLTPFDTEFDEATGKTNYDSNFKLLDENLQLINSGVLKYKFGRFVNQKVNNKTFFEPSLEAINSESDFSPQANYQNQEPLNHNSIAEDVARKIFYNPDGFVYRWKKGIGTAWIGNSARNLVGNVLSEENQDNTVANIIRTDPFSGQDVVNIISLLITGEPYNLNTFLSASIESGILRITPGETINDYITALSRQVRRQNQIWGNFVPYKRFTVNPSLFNQIFTSQLTLKSQSKKIDQLETQKAQLMQKIAQLDSSFQRTENLANLQGFNFNSLETTRTITTNNDVTLGLIRKVLHLDNEIKLAKAKIENSWLEEGAVRVFSNDVYSSYIGELSSSQSQSSYKEIFNRLKVKQNFITQRKLWQVKANNDPNLFIVADEYDHDVDIQAIVQSLGSLDLINSRSFPTVGSKIDAVAKLIGMEIFANSQGHIELRIPQYNKVPSSLFFKMAMKKKNFGIQYYPTFLEKTFQNRLNNVYNEIEYLEDEIRIYSTLLGCKNDEERKALLSGSDLWKKNKFVFLTTEENGSLLSLQAATSQITLDFTDDYEMHKTFSITTTSKGDFFERNTDNSFLEGRFQYFSSKYKGKNKADFVNHLSPKYEDENGIKRQVEKLREIVFSTSNNFDPIQKVNSLNEVFKKNIEIGDAEVFEDIKMTIYELLSRQQRRTGRKIEVSDFIKNKFPNSKKYTSPIDLLNIQKQLSLFVSQRYKAILSAASLIKNIDQAARANAPDSSVLADIMLPNLTKGGNIPDFMLHMIEDETEDDYGYQSGKRFIIKQQDILSTTYKEQPPNFTAIKVQGAEQGALIGGAGFDLGSGMETKTVWAVDYDLWRMYGFKDSAEKFMPFMNNVETQLAPYSIFLLNQQRANILHASVTRVGNEFVQPGEVYYLEYKDLLFYCEQVSHSFTYGTPGSFQTTMSLTYGHPIGQYIPTPLDVIGKSIYRGHYTNIGSYRLTNPVGSTISPGAELPLGSLVFVNTNSLLDPQQAGNAMLSKNAFSQQNKKILTDIQYKIKNIISSNLANTSTDKYAVVSIRIYQQENRINPNLEQAALFVRDYLKNPSSEEETSILRLSKERIVGGREDSQYEIDTFRRVEIKNTNSEITNTIFPTIRTPSTMAIENAKRVAELQTGIFAQLGAAFTSAFTENQTDVKAQRLYQAITNNIIDVWIEFINLEEAGIQQSAPFNSDEIKEKQQTTKNEVDLDAVDNFYNNVKSTDEGLEVTAEGIKREIKIKYEDPTNKQEIFVFDPDFSESLIDR